jgi:hypothetical protein
MFQGMQQDYILLIMNCIKYRYKAETQKETWLENLPANILYFHVLGDPEAKDPFYFDFEGHVLWVKTNDDYNSLPHKVISAYEAIQKTFSYKYIFKTDDDQMLKTDAFFPMITNLTNSMNPKVHYGGYIVDVPFQHISKYYLIHPELPKNLLIEKIKYCNGRFYLLSKEAVRDLVSKKTDIQSQYLEDYGIGLYLDPKFKMNILPIDTKKYFEDGTS